MEVQYLTVTRTVQDDYIDESYTSAIRRIACASLQQAGEDDDLRITVEFVYREYAPTTLVITRVCASADSARVAVFPAGAPPYLITVRRRWS